MKSISFKLFSVLIILAITLVGCKKSEDNPSVIEDIDGNEYDVIQIGNQFWMKQNLKVTKLNDGESIPEDNLTWSERTDPAWGHVNDNSANNAKYGKLYNGFAVASGKLCPDGWRVPSVEDWDELVEFLGSSLGGKLKATTDEWDEPNIDATNSSGFTALPAGERDINANSLDFGIQAFFWTSTPNIFETEKLEFRLLRYDFAGVLTGYADKRYGRSCRCIKE